MRLELPLETPRDEIGSGKRDIEVLLGKPADGLAYPIGRAVEEAEQIGREAGIMSESTSLYGVVGPQSNLYELKRFRQNSVTGERFLQYLNL